VVRGIPRDLTKSDISNAFENEAGPIIHCDLKAGVARMQFERPEHAARAVETFDRGELNGRQISVTLED